jgi:hypothetical protein
MSLRCLRCCAVHLSSALSCVFQAEVCAGTVAEVIQSVVNGADGCVFCFGHAKLGEWKLDFCLVLITR